MILSSPAVPRMVQLGSRGVPRPLDFLVCTDTAPAVWRSGTCPVCCANAEAGMPGIATAVARMRAERRRLPAAWIMLSPLSRSGVQTVGQNGRA
jgi:hypothetical protein